eukprot:1565821-Pyramimonas_sp.AAC.1
MGPRTVRGVRRHEAELHANLATGALGRASYEATNRLRACRNGRGTMTTMVVMLAVMMMTMVIAMTVTSLMMMVMMM